MRYDDYEEYSGRSSRNSSSRRSSSSYSGDYDRGYSSRDYDRGYQRDYDRDHSRSYDRDFDRDYDRSYSRDYDRYGSSRSSRSSYSDFDEYDWERTAPNWDDRSSARRKSGGSSRSSNSRSSSRPSGSRNSSSRNHSSSSSRSGGSRNGSSRRPPADNRRRNGSQRRPAKKKSLPLVPIILGVVLIVLAALIIKSFLGSGSSRYQIELSSQTIVQGETAEATITGLSATEDYDITWSSSDSGVVSVEGSGKTCTLSAKSVGTVSIAATVNDETINATVMVVKTAPGVVKIDLAETSAQIMSGKTYTIQATVVMETEDMTPAKITWSSNDNSVARVDSNGVVEARDVGTAIIKATAGEKTAEFVVEVIENPDSQPVDGTQTTGQEPEEGADVTTGTGGNTGTGTNAGTGTGTDTGTGSSGTDTTGSQGTDDSSSQDAGGDTTGQDAEATQ